MFFFFKQKTAYEMRISDWSSDVCSSDLFARHERRNESPSEIQRGSALHPIIAATSTGRPARRSSMVMRLSSDPARPTGAPASSVSPPLTDRAIMSSEVSRVGKEGVRTCRSRWSQYHLKKKEHNTKHSNQNSMHRD